MGGKVGLVAKALIIPYCVLQPCCNKRNLSFSSGKGVESRQLSLSLE